MGEGFGHDEWVNEQGHDMLCHNSLGQRVKLPRQIKKELVLLFAAL